MQRLLRSALLTALVSIALSAPAKPRLDDLTARLGSSDFRVRVQAALELGRSGDSRALEPLVGALDDRNASVRAAAAAALGKLGDTRGRAPLAEHRSDSSSAVRSEIKNALDKLTPKATAGEEPRKIVVKLGGVHNGTRVKSPAVERDVLAESKKKLDEMGVAVVSERADESNSENAPITLVSRKAAAPLIERSTWLSAARCITRSGRKVLNASAMVSPSPISAFTKR